MDFGLICLIYLIGLILLLLELFSPGIIMASIGIVMVATAIVLAFIHYPPLFGTALLGIAIVVVPSVLIWVLKRITLASSQKLEEGYTSTEEKFDNLLGKEGITITTLRPSGMALVEKRRIDVTAETVMLEKDTPIKIVKVEGGRIVVRATGPAPVQE